MADPNFENRLPGVYVSGIGGLPPSVAGIETAVPAFIGYTERAENSGEPAVNVPVRIASMMDFEQCFGGGVLDVVVPGKLPSPKFSLTPVQAPTPAPDGSPAEANAPAQGTYDVAYRIADGTATLYAKLTPRRPLFSLHNSLRLFYANGGGPCYIVSVGSYADPLTSDALLRGLEAIKDTKGPTLLVIPDASLLPIDQYGNVAKAMMKQAHDKQDRAALLDVPQVRSFHSGSLPALGDAISAFRASIGADHLSYGIAYVPYLNTTIVTPTELDYTLFAAGELTDYLMAERRNRDPAGAKELEFLISRIHGDTTDAASIRSTNQDLVNVLPQLTQLYEAAARQFNLLPASVAMAGVLTIVDNIRGVWNAPANIVLNAVENPAFEIDDEMQADLHTPLDGKAINAIREFAGRGSMVWGARTLDGNSDDYRYVQARRTVIYIEQSIAAALNSFVSAPNDDKTWVAVVAMVSNFLQNLWARGGLMGATAQEAFSVNCGPGTSMTAQDVLEGNLVVQVLVALIHPAAFIELTFKQKMEAAS
jgi:hypothetical protein